MAKRLPVVRGLRRRWLLNSVGPVLLIILLITILAGVAVNTTYYGTARSSLEAKAKASADYFNTYTMNSYSEYYRTASLYVASFDESDVIELQFLNVSGQIETSTRGLTAGTSPGTPEIALALESGAVETFNGADPATGERIMSVSSPLVFNGVPVGLMRYVTSTRQIDRQAVLVSLTIAAAVLGVALLVVVSNLIFINNVVEPVAEVTEAAKRISGGSYGIQIPNRYSDEIGELVENINDMSLKISQSEKMQTEFISSVSHELRTPLTAINGWGETLLADESSDSTQLRRGVGIILKESRRLTNMVEELLEFSKMQDGRFTLRVESVDLQAEFEDAIYTYRELFRQEGIQLEYEDGGELFEQSISGDPERLKQVFCNVLDNAAKHGGAGKRITASMAREGDEYVLRIRDYGPGIPEAELPYVKQKFYKGSSRARGSGIGLAVCDEIVQRHGGTFEIGNAEGGGAVVTIRLPIEEN
ncbi:MAG: HAMP domain-containing histidine kinase [Ruminococcaceae bacterium]|jgi:signal transduction histidine kinase|nr:HAMP domain-containing histidine kinase [Oscillospiraceae bacterium]